MIRKVKARRHNVAMRQIVEDLQSGTYDERTLEDTTEMIVEMAKNDESKAKSYLEKIISHVLKWEYQPNRRTQSWIDTVYESLKKISNMFEDSKSLENKTRKDFDKVYRRAKRDAESDTGLKMPDKPPYTFDEYIDIGLMKSIVNDKGLKTNFYYREDYR